MSLKTRFFGERIEGKALERLVVAMGENPRDILHYKPGERWTSGEPRGRVNLSPSESGIDVDLYVFNKAFHTVDGTLTLGLITNPLSGEQSYEHGKHINTGFTNHVTGTINYAGEQGEQENDN